MADNPWQSGEVMAWTEREGPGRTPRGPGRHFSTGVAATLGAVFVGIMSTDTLCPEHRAWVQGLATLALIGAVTAMVGLVRGAAWAPWVTLASAGAGVAIGLIDAAHAPQRGRLVAGGFALVVLLASALAIRAVRLGAWERQTLLALRPVQAPDMTPAAANVLASPDRPASPATSADRERASHTTPR